MPGTARKTATALAQYFIQTHARCAPRRHNSCEKAASYGHRSHKQKNSPVEWNTCAHGEIAWQAHGFNKFHEPQAQRRTCRAAQSGEKKTFRQDLAKQSS